MERRAEEQLQASKGNLVVIIMGSEGDKDYSSKIAETLTKLQVPSEMRIASAHKSTRHLLRIIGEYNKFKDKRIVFIAVAGRSNALGGVIDANTTSPVISAPPYSEKYGGVDVFSSLRMPSGMGATVAIEPDVAALAAVKTLALNDPELSGRLLKYQRGMQQKILDADQRIRQDPL